MKTTICVPGLSLGHSTDKVKVLTDLEVLQTIAKFNLELNWDYEDDEEEESENNQLRLAVFPTTTGGSWFYGCISSPPEQLEADKVELIRTVVSRIAYCAQFSRGGITDLFDEDDDGGEPSRLDEEGDEPPTDEDGDF